MPDLGDIATATLTVTPYSGSTAATLLVTAPDSSTSSPSASTADSGHTWTATVTYSQAGWWLFKWTVTGTGAGVEYQQVFVSGAPIVPVGAPYAGLEELKARLGGVSGSSDDAALTNALAVASRGIEKVCGRQFNQSASATARVYYPCSYCLAEVDDFYTTSGLIIATDSSNDGVYETTWAASDYQLEPLNGVVDGESGWPFWKIRAVAARRFWYSTGSYTSPRAPLQVTAKWGWSAVPVGVKEACLAVAEETFKLKDAPWGVAGVGEWGTMRVRSNPMVMAMIAPYRLNPVLVA